MIIPEIELIEHGRGIYTFRMAHFEYRWGERTDGKPSVLYMKEQDSAHLESVAKASTLSEATTAVIWHFLGICGMDTQLPAHQRTQKYYVI